MTFCLLDDNADDNGVVMRSKKADKIGSNFWIQEVGAQILWLGFLIV